MPTPFLRRALFLCLFATAPLASTALAAKPVWLKVETPDFVLYSNASERDATDCALRYAIFRSVFRQLFVAPGHAMPPSVVLAFRSTKEFRHYTPLEKSRGSDTEIVNYHTEVDGVACSAFAIAGDRDRAMQLTFEFETIWAMPHLGYYVPLWMAQGSGEILSHLEIRKDRCLIGADDRPSVGEAVPWPKFFAINSDSKTYRDPETVGDYLNQAWALMHWILFNDSGIRARFADTAIRLRTAEPGDAVALSMATPPDHFNAAIRDHFRHGHFPVAVPIDEATLRSTFRIGPAPQAEVLVRTGDFLLATGQEQEADVQLDQARALAPDLPAVKEAWARRMLREGRPDDAVALYREAIDAGSRNIVTFLRSAEGRLNDMQTGGRDVAGEGGTAAVTAVEEIRHALQLDPGNAQAYFLLGRAFFILPKVTDAHLAELGQGLVPGADGVHLRLYHGLLAHRLGHFDEAVADMRQIEAEPGATIGMRESAARQRVGFYLGRDQKALTPLLEAGDFAAAHKILADGLAALGDGGEAEPYRTLAANVDELEAWEKFREIYGARDWTKTRDAAADYLEKHPKGAHAATVRRLAAEAASHLKEPAATGSAS